jgi:hypothetical protein
MPAPLLPTKGQVIQDLPGLILQLFRRQPGLFREDKALSRVARALSKLAKALSRVDWALFRAEGALFPPARVTFSRSRVLSRMDRGFLSLAHSKQQLIVRPIRSLRQILI